MVRGPDLERGGPPATPACAYRASLSADQDSVQMLQRSSQVGEFYRMSPPAVFDSTKRLPPSYMGDPYTALDLTPRALLTLPLAPSQTS